MKSKEQVANQFNKHLSLSKRGLGSQYDNTRYCQSFYDGDFMKYEDKIAFVDQLGRRRRAIVQFNKVKPNVDAVGGFLMQNRQQAKYIARLNNNVAQKLFSRYSNSLKDYIRDNMNADQVESQQDYDMLINGYGATETDISYIRGQASTDPNGEVIKVRLDPLCVGWDSTAIGRNLLDARWAYYWKDYDLTEAMDLLDDTNPEDFEKTSASEGENGYHYYPYGGRYDKIREQDTVEWADKQEDRVRVYNYQWFEYENFYRAENPLYSAPTPEAAFRIQIELDTIAAENPPEGDMFDFDPRAKILTFDDKIKSALVAAFGKYIAPVKFKRKAYYTAIISGKHVFSVFRSIHQQNFSIQFKTGTYAATKKIWVGMVNQMAEPTKYYNKALTELMFTIAANSKGGVMYEKGSIEDVADFEKKWAKTDAVVEVADGAISGSRIKEKAQPQMPTGLQEIVALSDQAVQEGGVAEAFRGLQEKQDMSGVLYKRRIRQIISTMAQYPDAITLYQKADARMLLDYIRVYVENNDGSMFRITGEAGANEYALISQDKMAAEYDVTIEEAPQTPEDKMETAEVLSNMADKFLSAGDANAAKALYVVGIDYLKIDDEAKQKLSEALAPTQQIDPQEHEALKQQVAILSSETNKADVEQKLSTAALNRQKINESQASTTQKGALTAKTIEEAQKTDVETAILRKEGTKVNASI